jgi:hypothetical protein
VLDLFALDSGTVRRWGEKGAGRKRVLPPKEV